jgi:hypothetical protein
MTPKEYAIRLLENARGDDLERARWAFRGLTPMQMAEQHGQSGKTRQEILGGYEAERVRYEAALAWARRAQ